METTKEAGLNEKIISFVIKALTTRWRTLRDRYAKERREIEVSQRSGAEPTDYTPWEYSDQMDFLKDHVSRRATTSNYDTGTKELANMVEEYLEVEEGTPEPPRSSMSKKRKADVLDDKMSAVLDRFMDEQTQLRHTHFAQLVNAKLSAMPIDKANRLEAAILNILYTVEED
ncbi:uncharacterized protein LOC134227796 [Armigeres subalbatus]|uniref:uncharacterized protein LOC134227796 n=1 Tax=Armigeres subalbatus TaxID=124917 RepID=UPI002ED00D15